MMRALLVAGMLGALLLTPTAPAQQPAPTPLSKYEFQTHVLRRLLFDLNFEALSGPEKLEQEPADTLFIVLGDTSCLDSRMFVFGLSQFVKLGGAALVATDRQPDLRARQELAQTAGVTISGEQFIDPNIDSDEVFAGMDFCPFLVSAPTNPDLFHSPRLTSLQRLQVATNTPSRLIHVQSGWPGSIKPLAWLPYAARPDGQPARTSSVAHSLRRILSGPLFAVGGQLGDGRILVLADHSIFINEMMLREDNNNVEFSYNCLEWLRDTGTDRRHKVLFVEDGVVHTDLDVPMKATGPLPPGASRAIVAAMDRAIQRLEEQNAFNNALWKKLGPPQTVLRGALVIGTLMALAYLAFRITTRSRYRLDLAVPLLARQVDRHSPTATLLQQRGQQALNAGNLWEAAHGLAREWFAGLGQATQSPPPVRTAGGRWRQWVLDRRIRRLWMLAQQTEPSRVSPRRLRQMLHELDQLRAAQRSGTLSFGGPPSAKATKESPAHERSG